MKILKTITLLTLILMVVSSCVFDKTKKDIDSFYITKNYGQFPVMPLIKPVKLLQDAQSLKWGIEYHKHSFKQRISTYNLKEIGIDKTYVW